MRSILVLNPRGGTGKTTLAINLAAWFAIEGKRTALVDFDPQQSSLDWLAMRSEDRPGIDGVCALEPGARVPRGTEVAILDAPAATHGRAISELLRRAQTCVIPVVPSIIDLNAAARFMDELVEIERVLQHKVRVGTVANRVRENSPGRYELEDYLRSMKLPDGRRLPFVAMLRNTQNYVHAAERGLSIFEIAPSRTTHDLELWEPLTRWLSSKRSLPS
jgi:chromosome partitioning protein